MRLGFDLSPLAGFGSPGVQRATRGLFAALRARQVHEWLPLEPPPGVGSLRWRQWLLPQRARQLGLEGLHCSVSALPLAAAVPLLQTVQELPWRRFEPEGSDLAHRAWVRLGARRAAAVLVPSPATLADWRAELPRAARAPELVPWGGAESLPRLEREAARDEVRRRLGIGSPYLLFPGSTRPKKRLPELVRYLAAAPAARGLALVVSGPPSPSLSAAAREAERSGLHLISADSRLDRPIGDELLAALIAGAAAVLSAARSEGFGFPILEALALGTPALVQAGSGPELSFPAALAVDLADPAALSEALGRAQSLGSAERRELVASVAGFTWERAAAAVEALWERLA